MQETKRPIAPSAACSAAADKVKVFIDFLVKIFGEGTSLAMCARH
jgi:hypothetical protein